MVKKSTFVDATSFMIVGVGLHGTLDRARSEIVQRLALRRRLHHCVDHGDKFGMAAISAHHATWPVARTQAAARRMLLFSKIETLADCACATRAMIMPTSAGGLPTTPV